MYAENSLGMNIQELRRHEYCMTSNHLTEEENVALIGRLDDIVAARPQDVRFQGSDDGTHGYAFIDGIRLVFNEIGMQMEAPARLLPWYFSSYKPARVLYDRLHVIRHSHHNAAVVASLAEAVGGSFVAGTPQPVQPVEPAPEPVPIAAVADQEVKKMKAMVSSIMAHPIELVGTVAILSIIVIGFL